MTRARQVLRLAWCVVAVGVVAAGCSSGASGEVPTPRPEMRLGEAGAGHAREPAAATTCAACHMPEYDAAPHHRGEKPTTCARCHSQADWRPLRRGDARGVPDAG